MLLFELIFEQVLANIPARLDWDEDYWYESYNLAEMEEE